MQSSGRTRHADTTKEACGATSSDKVLHLLYHELSTAPVSNSYQIQTEMFHEHLNELARHLDGPIRPVVTFDDGHRSNYEYAVPMLEKSGIKAVFFVTVGWIVESRNSCMSWNDLRALSAAGHTIGAHGWSHKLFTHCDARELRREIVDAKSELEEHLGASITALSFPGGRSNHSSVQTALDAGYMTLYTSQPTVETTPLGTFVGRVNVRSDWGPSYMAALLAEDQHAIKKLRRQSMIKDAAKSVLGDRLYSKLWTAVNGKDVEPESFGGANT